MKVSEAIEKLKTFDPDAELHFCTNHDGGLNGSVEAEEITAAEATYGILTPAPRVVSTVVLDTMSCGL